MSHNTIPPHHFHESGQSVPNFLPTEGYGVVPNYAPPGTPAAGAVPMQPSMGA